MPFHYRQFFSVEIILNFRQSIQYFKYPLSGGYSPLNTAIDISQPFDRVSDVDGVNQKSDQRTGSQIAIDDLPSTVPDNHRDADRR